MCVNKFKGLSAYAAPYVVQDVELLTTNCIESVELEKVGIFTYYTIQYKPISDNQMYWLKSTLTKESNVCSLCITDTLCAKFIFPQHTDLITSLLLNNDIEFVTKSVILDNVEFWKENAFLVCRIS